MHHGFICLISSLLFEWMEVPELLERREWISLLEQVFMKAAHERKMRLSCSENSGILFFKKTQNYYENVFILNPGVGM